MEHLCKRIYKNVKLVKESKTMVIMPSYADSSELTSCIVDLLFLQHSITHGLMH